MIKFYLENTSLRIAQIFIQVSILDLKQVVFWLFVSFVTHFFYIFFIFFFTTFLFNTIIDIDWFLPVACFPFYFKYYIIFLAHNIYKRRGTWTIKTETWHVIHIKTWIMFYSIWFDLFIFLCYRCLTKRGKKKFGGNVWQTENYFV